MNCLRSFVVGFLFTALARSILGQIDTCFWTSTILYGDAGTWMSYSGIVSSGTVSTTTTPNEEWWTSDIFPTTLATVPSSSFIVSSTQSSTASTTLPSPTPFYIEAFGSSQRTKRAVQYVTFDNDIGYLISDQEAAAIFTLTSNGYLMTDGDYVGSSSLAGGSALEKYVNPPSDGYNWKRIGNGVFFENATFCSTSNEQVYIVFGTDSVPGCSSIALISQDTSEVISSTLTMSMTSNPISETDRSTPIQSSTSASSTATTTIQTSQITTTATTISSSSSSVLSSTFFSTSQTFSMSASSSSVPVSSLQSTISTNLPTTMTLASTTSFLSSMSHSSSQPSSSSSFTNVISTTASSASTIPNSLSPSMFNTTTNSISKSISSSVSTISSSSIPNSTTTATPATSSSISLGVTQITRSTTTTTSVFSSSSGLTSTSTSTIASPSLTLSFFSSTSSITSTTNNFSTTTILTTSSTTTSVTTTTSTSSLTTSVNSSSTTTWTSTSITTTVSSSTISSTSSSSNITSPSQRVAKRGLAYTNVNTTILYPSPNLLSWAYNYFSLPNATNNVGPYPYGNPNVNGSNLRFIPTLYNDASSLTSIWSTNVNYSIVHYGTDALFSFNEPDYCLGGKSACMSISRSINAYQQYIQPYSGILKLGAPSITNTNTGLPYLQQFLGNASQLNLTVDFINLHWYASPYNFQYFTDYITNISIISQGKKIWISEYGMDNQGYSDLAVQAFIKNTTTWLDQQNFIERYSWFGNFGGYLLNQNLTSLSNQGVIWGNYSGGYVYSFN